MKDPGSSKRYFGWHIGHNERARNPQVFANTNSFTVFSTGRNEGKTNEFWKEVEKYFLNAAVNRWFNTGSFVPKFETMEDFKFKPEANYATGFDICKLFARGVDTPKVSIFRANEYKSIENLSVIKILQKHLEESMIQNNRKAPIGNENVQRKHLYSVGDEIFETKSEKTLVITSLIPIHSGEEPRYYAKFKGSAHSHIVKESQSRLEEE